MPIATERQIVLRDVEQGAIQRDIKERVKKSNLW
jgi:hypothetical protein